MSSSGWWLTECFFIHTSLWAWANQPSTPPPHIVPSPQKIARFEARPIYLKMSRCSMGTTSSPLHDPESSIPITPNTLPPYTHRISEQREGTKKPSSSFLVAIAATSPEVASHPSLYINTQLLTIFMHKPCLGWAYHYTSTTTYIISLLQFRWAASLALISGTGEAGS